MVDSSEEDTRKKRDNAQVHNDHEEKPKKIQKGESKVDGDGKENDDGEDDDSNAAILPSPPKRRATERSACAVMNASVSLPGEDSVASPSSPRKQQRKEPRFASAKSAASTARRQAEPTSETDNSNSNAPTREIWDLESAMLYLVRLHKVTEDKDGVPKYDTGEAAIPKPPSSPQPRPDDREYVTAQKDSWVTFGMAHSGDAATIASWYHASLREKEAAEAKQQQKEEEEKPEIAVVREGDTEEVDGNNVDQETGATSSAQQLQILEHSLAEGLGDEVTCPSVYGLLAYVHSDSATGDDNNKDERDDHLDDGDKKPKATNAKETADDKSNNDTTSQRRMAAVALITLAWTSKERHLRVEWMAVDSKNLSAPVAQAVQQKVWLRISVLSVMTACPVVAVDETLLREVGGRDQSEAGDEDEKSCKKKAIPPSAE